MCTCVTAHMWRLEGIFRSRHSPCRPPWAGSGCHRWQQAPQRSRLSSPFAKSLAEQSRLIHRELRRTWRAHFTEIRGLCKLHWEKNPFYSQGTFPNLLQGREVEKLRLGSPSHCWHISWTHHRKGVFPVTLLGNITAHLSHQIGTAAVSHTVKSTD